jgi:hypothetical protein
MYTIFNQSSFFWMTSDVRHSEGSNWNKFLLNLFSKILNDPSHLHINIYSQVAFKAGALRPSSDL